MKPLPPPGTLADLLDDARRLGWDTNERMLRKLKDLGLLASPARRSLGRGQGQAPAVYSREQRHNFQIVAHWHTLGRTHDQIARFVVYSWLYQHDAFVTTPQAKAAMATALGKLSKSLRVAGQTASLFVDSLPAEGARQTDKARLRRLIVEQLRAGRVDAEKLRPAIAKLLDRGPISAVRGPAGAQLSTDAAIEMIDRQAKAAAHLPKATVAELDRVRTEHRITWAQYLAAQPALRASAPEDIRDNFDVPNLADKIDGAVSTTLLLLGLLFPREDTK